MFSRTTIASSISRPIDSDSASSVMVFTVKLNTHMMKKALMIEMGRVRPVITVERELVLYRADCGANALRVVTHDRHLDVGRERAAEIDHRRLHRVGHRHG